MPCTSNCLGLPKNNPSAPAGLTSFEANNPVAKAPQIPPTQCTPKASSESSYPNFGLIKVTAIKQNTLTNKPIIMAGITLTKPAAGVIATNPATAPEQRPNIVGFPLCHHSSKA